MSNPMATGRPAGQPTRSFRQPERTPTTKPAPLPPVPPAVVSQSLVPVASKKASKPPKKPKAVRTTPAGVCLPRHGRAGLHYFWNRIIGHPERVPPITNSKERDAQATIQLGDELRAWSLIVPNLSVVFANGKGGASKTPIDVLTSSLVSKETGRNVGTMPAADNFGTSNTGQYAGVFGDNPTVWEFYERAAELLSYQSQIPLFVPTRSRLLVITEDHNVGNAKRRFDRAAFTRVADTFEPSLAALFFDTANEMVTEDSLVYAAAERADVVVFVATADNPGTLDGMLHTSRSFYGYVSDGNPSADDEGSVEEVNGRTGYCSYGITEDKVRNSIFVISKVTKEKLDSFESFIGIPGYNGPLMSIPYDKYIGTKNVTPVADLEALEPKTYLAFLRLCVQLYKQAALNRHIDVSTIPSYLRPITPVVAIDTNKEQVT